MRPMRVLSLWFMVVVGCGPSIPPEELGHVVYEVPAVPGGEAPYPVPELEATAGESNEQ